MSFESDPTRGHGDASDDSGRERSVAETFVSAVDTLEAIPKRVETHLAEWSRRYVEMRVTAVSGKK